MATVCRSYIQCRLAFVPESSSNCFFMQGISAIGFPWQKGLVHPEALHSPLSTRLCFKIAKCHGWRLLGGTIRAPILRLGHEDTWQCLRSSNLGWLAVGAKGDKRGGISSMSQNFNPISRQSQSDEWSNWTVSRTALMHKSKSNKMHVNLTYRFTYVFLPKECFLTLDSRCLFLF